MQQSANHAGRFPWILARMRFMRSPARRTAFFETFLHRFAADIQINVLHVVQCYKGRRMSNAKTRDLYMVKTSNLCDSRWAVEEKSSAGRSMYFPSWTLAYSIADKRFDALVVAIIHSAKYYVRFAKLAGLMRVWTRRAVKRNYRKGPTDAILEFRYETRSRTGSYVASDTR